MRTLGKGKNGKSGVRQGDASANVQCACRSCNARKGGHTVVGQLPLLGAT